MQLPQDPKTPLLIRAFAFLVALAVAGLIVWLVFTFGYYASGLAVLDEAKRQEELRKGQPIPLQFGDPNRDANAPSPADANAD